MIVKASFFFDSKALGRAWTFDVSNQALSGTDSVLLQVYTGLRDMGEEVRFFCTSPPVDGDENCFVVEGLIDAYQQSCMQKIPFFIYNYNTKEEQFRLLEQVSFNDPTKLLPWAQNPPSYEWLQAAQKCPAFYQMVVVSNVQRNDIAHHKLFAKTTVIHNFIEPSIENHITDLKGTGVKDVVYIGALKSSKGFHHLANVWPKVKQILPAARLTVCGSPGLYNSDSILGPEGIAEVEYEKQVLSPLGGSRRSAQGLGVNFRGSVAKDELYKVIQESSLVVVNPNISGSLETFCVSAVEAMFFSIPVVGGNAGGLTEIIGDGIAGILASNESELSDAIVSLLNDRQKALSMGANGRNRVVSYFVKDIALSRWKAMLNREYLTNYSQAELNKKNFKFILRSISRVTSTADILKSLHKLIVRN